MPASQPITLLEWEKAAKPGDASDAGCDALRPSPDGAGQAAVQASCENGKPVLYRVDDPEGLDARRKELSMGPAGDYLRKEYVVKFSAALAK